IRPHLPFVAPKKYWDLYDRSKIPFSPSMKLPHDVSTASFHNSGEFNSYLSGDEHPTLAAPVSEAYARKITHAYYASVSYTDAQIGKLLQALNDYGLEESTIVILWGDHGWHLGDHRVWGKHTLSERALKSPLIIRAPGMKIRGKTSDAIVSSVDIYPTLMDLCKVPMPYETDGATFIRLMENPGSKSFVQPAYSFYNNGITMRTDRYRITHYFRKEQLVTELYDHKNDPNENFNIAADDERRVRQLLRKWKKGDTGLYGDDKVRGR
ncbi:MAG: sulfatase/phosphatase domain-containing protein, partial [Cyclobacteriaceae bacterium]